MKKLILLFACIPLLMSSTCDHDSDEPKIPCTAEARAGLNVTVKDANTSAVLTEGVSVIATEGEYSETLQLVEGDNTFVGAWERSGYYVLTVNKPGYQTGISDLIIVSRDRCHVVPRSVNIMLQPE